MWFENADKILVNKNVNVVWGEGSCVWNFRLLHPGVSGVLSFRLDFFLVFFPIPFFAVFVGNFDFPRQGVPIAFCIANLSDFGAERKKT
jgi:hypothetical protein